MVAAITCTNCEREVVFDIEESEKLPTKTCKCGAVYQLRARRLE